MREDEISQRTLDLVRPGQDSNLINEQPVVASAASEQFQPVTTPESWHNILCHLPHAHALQSWVWGEFKSRWGWSMLPLVMGREDKPGAAALVLKRQASGLPFSILYVPKGPIFDYSDERLRDRVLMELEAIARRERAIFIKIDPDVVRSRGPEPDEETPNPLGERWITALEERNWRFSHDQVQFRNTVALKLDKPEEELLAGMKSKTRYNVRLAGRRDVVVRRATKDDFPTIAALYEQTADRNEFAIRPTDYYLDAWQSFYAAGMAQPLLAEYQGTLLGAVIVVAYGNRALYMYGASNEKERKRMPNYLLQWEAIRWAKEQGCEVYDFWGAPDEFVESDSMWGVWRFKSGFGADVVRHIGAWDYPARPFWYWLYSVVMPKYLGWLRKRAET